MTRIVRPGEEKHAQRPLHPVLKKVPAVRVADAEALSAYFYDNPRSVEIIEWINDNLDPIFRPNGLILFWWGLEPFDDEDDHVPMSVLQKAPSSRWVHDDSLFEKKDQFDKNLISAFPDASKIVSVVV